MKLASWPNRLGTLIKQQVCPCARIERRPDPTRNRRTGRGPAASLSWHLLPPAEKESRQGSRVVFFYPQIIIILSRPDGQQSLRRGSEPDTVSSLSLLPPFVFFHVLCYHQIQPQTHRSTLQRALTALSQSDIWGKGQDGLHPSAEPSRTWGIPLFWSRPLSGQSVYSQAVLHKICD